MASDTINVAIEKRHFDGGDRLTAEHRRTGSSGAKHLAQILRNTADELNERVQSGSGVIAAAGVGVEIELPVAMPNTSYDVILTPKVAMDTKGVGNVHCTLFCDPADHTTAKFKVSPSPAGAVVAQVDFFWMVRSRTRINSKK